MASSSSPSTSSSTAQWRPEEFCRKASSWTLEGDAKLLEFMQNIAANLESRATKTTEAIHRLSLDVDRTDVALGNVTNKLAALQHSQFVENRVYEDDETIANVAEVPVSDEADTKSNYDPVETLSKLLDSSMTVLDRCYEKVSIDVEDSDEEDEAAKSVIYRPKDPYEDRPLPHIIGSKDWMEKWHVGLCDSDDDFSGDEKEDEFSESSDSVSMSASLPSNAPTVSESELSAWGLQQNSLPSHMKRHTDSYGSSDEDILNATKSTKLPRQPALLPPEMPTSNQYYVHKTRKSRDRGLFDSSDESTDSELYNVKGKSERTVPLPVPVMRRENRVSNIISDEPPPDLDVVDRRDQPQVDLFCESEDDAPVAASSSSKKEEPTSSNIRKKTVNLFDDDDFDSFMKELNTKTTQKVTKPVQNLFEESSDDDGGITKQPVSDVQSSEQTPKPLSSQISKEISQFQSKGLQSSNLVDEKSDKLLKQDTPVVVESQERSLKQPAKTTNLFDDVEDIGHLNNINQTPVAAKRTLISNLFDDDPPDDDFDSLFKSVQFSQSDKNARSDSAAKINKKLFDDSDENDDNVASSYEAKKGVEVSTEKQPEDLVENKSLMGEKREIKSTNLFAESDDDSADLFGGSVKSKINEDIPEKPSITETTKRETEVLSSISDAKEIQKEFASNKIIDNTDNHSALGSDRTSKVTKHNLPNIFGDDIFEDNDFISGKDTKPVDQDKIENDFNQEDNVTSSNISQKATRSIPTNDEIPENPSPKARQTSNIISASLFSDVPPEDDNFLSAETQDSKNDVSKDNFENNYPHESSNEFGHSSKMKESADGSSNAFNYNSVSLFSDSPPDDDFDATPQYGKKLHSIFYDDFSETVIPSQMDDRPKSLSSYIFDEPPPDSFEKNEPPLIGNPLNEQSNTSIFEEPVKKDAVNTIHEAKKDELHKVETEGKVASIIDQMQQNPHSEAEPESTLKIASQPKKINSNLNINVSALMPGAKRHALSSQVDQESASKVASQPKKINSNLNINVSALLPGAKRPQFKEKELSNNTPPINESSERYESEHIETVARNILTESDPSKLQSLNKTRAKIQVKRRPSTRKARQENYRRSLIDSSVHEPEEITHTDEVTGSSGSKSISVFKEELTTSVSEDTQSERPSAPTLFNTGPTFIPSLANEPEFKPSTVFFEDEPPDDFLETLPPRKVPEKASTTTSLFDDETDDNSFLKVDSSTIRSKLDSGLMKATSERKPEIPKNPSKSLFEDDVSDDSDLFANSLAKSVKQKTDEKPPNIEPPHSISVDKTETKSKHSTAPKTLFGSDDDDDDIFGSGVSTSKSKGETVMQNSGSSGMNTQPKLNAGRLFDDNEEDDDDLFGGTKQKTISQTLARKSDSKVKTANTKSSHLLKADSKKFDDPLADLFQK